MNYRILLFFVFASQIIMSQNINCNTSEANAIYFKNNPSAFYEYESFNRNSKHLKSQNEESYTIPVVFHVYGTSFNGRNVNDALIEKALDDLNKDFHGENDDFNSVHSEFNAIKSTLDVAFKLAKKDPNGNETTGIIYHAVKSGFGNASSSNSQIRADAWDNYKYMNVYIQNDLYDDDVTNNSGVAWYPNTNMSNNNLARVVYNGAYLATNTSKEFASVLTHEFGHWLNLIHTFEGGCTGTDQVDDTPKENGQHNVNCRLGTNCDGDYVNHENYMGYNGASGCYKMFTKGQVDRMKTALQHPARKPLWQLQNLIDTGVKITPENNVAPNISITNNTNNLSVEEGSSFKLTTSVTDSNGSDDINRVEFYIGTTLAGTVNSTPYEYTYTNLQIGNPVLKAVVYDEGGLSKSSEITIEVTKKINYPEIKWIASTISYTQNGTQFATGETARRIEIKAVIEAHNIVLKGPNNFQQNISTSLDEVIIIDNLEAGTWIIEIPELNKKISKTIN